MRDHTAETLLMIAGTLVGGFIGLGLIGGGIPALLCAGLGFGLSIYLLPRKNP